MHKFCRLKWESLATNKVTLILHWSFCSLPSENYKPIFPSIISSLYSLSASPTAPLTVLETTCTGARESCIRRHQEQYKVIWLWVFFVGLVGVFVGWFLFGFFIFIFLYFLQVFLWSCSTEMTTWSLRKSDVRNSLVQTLQLCQAIHHQWGTLLHQKSRDFIS